MPKLKKIMLIANPNAGRGYKLPGLFRTLFGFKHGNTSNLSNAIILNSVYELFKEAGIKADISMTSRRGDASRIARECLEENYDAVVAVGGDGTINEVINGIAETKMSLGIIPLGTANVFAIQMGIPADIYEAAKLIIKGKTKKIDLGLAGRRYFACMLGIGFDAHVIKTADSRWKKTFGALAYVIAAVFSYFFYKFNPIKLKLDNQPIKRSGLAVLVANGKYYGGSIPAAPKADFTDSYLDVCIFKCAGLFSFISYTIAAARGTLHKLDTVEYYQCKKISVMRKGRHHIHADAECIGRTPVKIKVCSKALRVIGNWKKHDKEDSQSTFSEK